MEAKKSLGQHFLIAPGISRQIARTATDKEAGTVVEIGPGKGMLTRELLGVFNRVIAIEKDAELITHLSEKFAAEITAGTLQLVSDDALSVDLTTYGITGGAYVLAANIPYNITGAIMRHFIAGDVQPHTAVLLIQKEVADQIAKTPSESILSISVKAYGTPEYIGKVRAACFRPRPRVDSAVLKVSHISKNRFIDTGVSEEWFFRIVRTGFAHKRKQLMGNLTGIAEKSVITAAFTAAQIPTDARAQTLSVDQWFTLAQEIPVSDCA